MQTVKNRKYMLAAMLIAALWAAIATAGEPANLLDGAAWQYSADGGKTFTDAPVPVPPGQTVHVAARATFVVEDPAPLAALELTHGLDGRSETHAAINGVEVRGPLEGMFYRTIPGISPGVLKQGANILTVDVKIISKAPATRSAKDAAAEAAKNAATRPADDAKAQVFAPKMTLAALLPEHLRIQTGPILGAAFDREFTVTCRTNLPATLAVGTTGGKPTILLPESPLGLIHRLRVPQQGGLVLHAEVAGHVVEMPLSAPAAPGGTLRFVALGDSRTRPQEWAKVAAAVADAHPDLVVFSGDMVADGRDDRRWDEEFVTPGAKLLASVPFYAIIGNHEKDAPLYDELFYTPSDDGRARNWAQQIGSVLLIGIDGTQDWTAGGENARWLEEQLRQSKADFIFLASHYSPWTSSKHGKLGPDGKPSERAVLQAREVVWPLLVKYRATAMIAGHDHVYERSEPPGGVTVIISGGAGAPAYDKVPAADAQNPYSKVFHAALHYCLFEIADGRCTMQARTPAGEVLDTRAWPARTRE